MENIPEVNNHIEYEPIFGNVSQQKEVAKHYINITTIRNKIIEEKEPAVADPDDDDDQDEDCEDPLSLQGALIS